MSRLKSSCAFSSWTMSSGFCVMSGHRLGAIEFGTAPLLVLQHLAQMFRGVPDVLEAKVQGREAEAQDVRRAGAEVADHAARDQGLHDRVSAFVARQADLRAALCMRTRRGQAEAVAGAALFDE